LICDYFLPGLNGGELIDQIRNVGKEMDLAIVLITAAELNDKDRLFIESLGADGVVSKGTSFESMLVHIKEVIEKKRNCTQVIGKISPKRVSISGKD